MYTKEKVKDRERKIYIYIFLCIYIYIYLYRDINRGSENETELENIKYIVVRNCLSKDMDRRIAPPISRYSPIFLSSSTFRRDRSRTVHERFLLSPLPFKSRLDKTYHGLGYDKWGFSYEGGVEGWVVLAGPSSSSPILLPFFFFFLFSFLFLFPPSLHSFHTFARLWFP